MRILNLIKREKYIAIIISTVLIITTAAFNVIKPTVVEAHGLFFKEQNGCKVLISPNDVFYNGKRVIEKIQPYFLFNNEKKAILYNELGKKRISEYLITGDINLVKDATNEFENSNLLLNSKNDIDLILENQNYVKEIVCFLSYEKTIDIVNKQELEIRNSEGNLKKATDSLCKLPDNLLTENNAGIISNDKQLLETIDIPKYYKENELTRNTLEDEFYKDIKNTQNTKSDLLVQQRTASTTKKYEQIKKDIANIQKYIEVMTNTDKEIMGQIASANSNIKKKIGFLDLTDKVVSESVNIIQDKFLNEIYSQFNLMQSQNKAMINGNNLSQNAIRTICTNKNKYISNLKIEEAKMINELEKTRTSDKYVLIKSLIGAYNESNNNLIENTEKTIDKTMPKISISGFNNKTSLKMTADKQIAKNNNFIKQINQQIGVLLKSNTKTKEIDNSISTLIHAFRSKSKIEVGQTIKDLKAIQRISVIYKSNIGRMTTLQEEYNKRINDLNSDLDRKIYDLSFTKLLLKKSAEQYVRIYVNDEISQINNELKRCIKNSESFSDCLEQYEDNKAEYRYKNELVDLKFRQDNIYSVAENYKQTEDYMNKSIGDYKKIYQNDYIIINEFAYRRNECSYLFNKEYSSNMNQINSIISKAQNGIINCFNSNKDSSEQLKQAETISANMIASVNKITETGELTLKIFFENVNSLDEGYKLKVSDQKNFNIFVASNIKNAVTNSTYAVEKCNDIKNTYDSTLDSLFEEYQKKLQCGSLTDLMKLVIARSTTEDPNGTFTGFSNDLSTITSNDKETVTITVNVELNMGVYLDSVNHLKREFEIIMSKEDLTAKALALYNEYEVKLSEKVAYQVDEILQELKSGMSKTQINTKIKRQYVSDIETLTQTYTDKIYAIVH